MIYIWSCLSSPNFFQLQKIEDVSQEIKRVRAQMEENEQLATLMRGLRGQNLRDSQFAEDNVRLRLVEVLKFQVLCVILMYIFCMLFH